MLEPTEPAHEEFGLSQQELSNIHYKVQSINGRTEKSIYLSTILSGAVVLVLTKELDSGNAIFFTFIGIFLLASIILTVIEEKYVDIRLKLIKGYKKYKEYKNARYFECAHNNRCGHLHVI